MNSREVVEYLTEEVARLRQQRQNLQDIETKIQATILHLAAHPRTNGSGPATSKNLAEVAYQRLSREGRPMHRKLLYDYLIGAGVSVGGQNPVGNMTAHMSQDARFESVGDGSWGLVEWRPKIASSRETIVPPPFLTPPSIPL